MTIVVCQMRVRTYFTAIAGYPVHLTKQVATPVKERILSIKKVKFSRNRNEVAS